MKFRTPYTEHVDFYSPNGSRYRKNYIKKLSPDGTPKLVENGIEDVYDSIQKAGQGLTIHDLIKRASVGDDTAIPAPIDSYADLSNMPTDILATHQMLLDAKERYLALPAELRSKFGNSFDTFLQAAADGSLGSVLTQTAQPTTSSLSEEELAKIRTMIGGNADA